MKKKLVTATIIILMLTSLLTLALNIQQVEASETIYIRADGSIDPPTAAIYTADNTTYIFTDNINDSIEIERSSIIIDGNGFTLHGPGSGEGMVLNNVSSLTIKDTTIRGFGSGIRLHKSYYNTLISNIVYDCGSGFLLQQSSHNTMSHNNITDNTSGSGIIIHSGSNHNKVTQNTIKHHDDYGVVLWGPTPPRYNEVYENNIIDCRYVGIRMERGPNYVFKNYMSDNGVSIYGYVAYDNSIYENIIENSEQGIVLTRSCRYNMVFGNVIDNCTRGVTIYSQYLGTSHSNDIFGNEIRHGDTGISCSGQDNRFYHNNVVDFAEPAYSSGISNVWDDGYPSGGNYWSNYSGTDLFSGPYQNETGSDGIGDTPYPIRFDSQDTYPLMQYWDATSPWDDDDNDGIRNYLDISNFDVLTSRVLEEVLLGFDWPVEITAIFPNVNYAYMMEDLYRWGVKTTDIQTLMYPVVMDLGNVGGALEWLNANAPWLITDQILSGAREYFCSDGHCRFLFFVHSDFDYGESFTVLAELLKACASGFDLEKWLDFFIDWFDLVKFELYLLKGVYSVSANLVLDLGGFAEFAKEFIMAWKDIVMILLGLELAFITATTAGGPAFLGLAGKLLVKAFKLFIDYIIFDHLKVKNQILDLIKIILVAVDPPGERVVLGLHNTTTDELLLGYNSTSGDDVSLFSHGIYSSDNDSALMILSRGVADYNFTVNRNVPGSSDLPYALVTWDCLDNYTLTTGGFLAPNQASSSILRVENDALDMSYLIVEANFSDFTPHVGDELTIDINVTDNLENPIGGANATIVVDNQFLLAQDLGGGKYRATVDTSSMLGFYNVTIFTAEPPDGHLQGISTYPLKVGAVDIAVTNVVCSKSIVGKNYLMSINVTVANEGSLNETFFITVYANSTVIKRLAILTLSGGNSRTITSTWNTTDVAYGNYTISVVSETIQGETDTADNSLTDGDVLVTIPGDVNGDRVIEALDLEALAKAYGSTITSPNWNANADINADGLVSIYDIEIAGSHWEESW